MTLLSPPIAIPLAADVPLQDALELLALAVVSVAAIFLSRRRQRSARQLFVE